MKSIITLTLLSLLTFFCGQSQHLIVGQENDSTLYLKSSSIQKVLIKFPEDYNPQKTYPLLVALHGNGGTAMDMASIFSPFKHEEVILAFPEGQYPRIITETIGFSWYFYTNDIKLSKFSDYKTLEQVNDVIDEISAAYKIKNIFIMGFSQGASLAYTIGFKTPEKITGVIAVGGNLPMIDGRAAIVFSKEIENAKHLNLFVSRGNRDRSYKKSMYLEQKEYLTKKGFAPTFFEYDGGHFLTPEFLEKVFRWIENNTE